MADTCDLTYAEDKIFEIPMAKINHRNQALKKHAMQWYKYKIDNLADFLFSQL